MKYLFDNLENNQAWKCFHAEEKGIGNLSLSEEALFTAASFRKRKRTIFIVKNNAYAVQKLYERIIGFLANSEEVMMYIAEESLRVEAIAYSPENKANQIEVMDRLISGKPVICIINTAAMMRFQSNPNLFKSQCTDLSVDQVIDYETLKNRLFMNGYTNVRNIDHPLCMATRGGIIDVFSCNYPDPIRIEFYDNVVESIRFFDCETRRTIAQTDSVHILPANTLLLSETDLTTVVEKSQVLLNQQLNKLSSPQKDLLEESVNADIDALINFQEDHKLYGYFGFLNIHYSIFDYHANSKIIISSIEEVERSIKHIQIESISYTQEMYELGKGLLHFHIYHDCNKLISNHKGYIINEFSPIKNQVVSNISTMIIGDHNLEATISEISKKANDQIVVIALNQKQGQYIQKILSEKGILFKKVGENKPWKQGINFTNFELFEGMELRDENIVVYTSSELFPEAKRIFNYSNKFKNAQVLNDFEELECNDYVVHNQYGIGKYLGIITKIIDGIHKDFLQIAYRGNDVLLVPLEQFKFVRKFVSKEGAAPKLHKLGSGEWEKTKKKVSEKIAELAERLVALYANRNQSIGFNFKKDCEMQQQFDQAFAYQLTHDQEVAIIEVKSDMESDKVMDRLLCGDVGFGKTEVACQASFKAVLSNKQVAFLCPTTILSLQHFETYKNRFTDYPVVIKVINRFISKSEQKSIISDLADGKIDILIGTHRLLSKDIKFKDIGLLVIDEEQRFGVEHKEKIKEYKNSVDVLSLSATPIPRTLQMSLIGVRSLSQLNTPPKNRQSVQTYVIEKNEGIIKDIIERELARNGQVFYLFNNIKEIYALSHKLQTLLPHIMIGIAHGQMSKDEIEGVMLNFRENKYQVLLCTTIIETGIDIPNANTIIVENADHFGLSQLYQIKGRVGRSARLAYAYLMYSPHRQLSEIASKRLKAIKEFAQLGSGYKIAMRDLTIRGAGDMLGPQQAGFIDSVGLDLYIEMLHHEIEHKQGILKANENELKKNNIAIDAYIPNTFETHDYAKIELYQRMENIKSFKELKVMIEEIQDYYGKLPKAIKQLFDKKRIQILSSQSNVERIHEVRSQIEIVFNETWSNNIDGVLLFENVTKISSEVGMHFTKQKIHMKIEKKSQWLGTLIAILELSQKS